MGTIVSPVFSLSLELVQGPVYTGILFLCSAVTAKIICSDLFILNSAFYSFILKAKILPLTAGLSLQGTWMNALWFSFPLNINFPSLILSSQFRCGERTVGGAQPPGPPGQPWLWSGYTGQLSSQPAEGILPVPLRLGL